MASRTTPETGQNSGVYLYNNKVDMPALSPEEEEKHQAARLRHICEKPFKPSDTRVHDHDHLIGNKLILDYYFTHQPHMLTLIFSSGAYRGPAHQDYNRNFQDSRTIPVVFHNLTDYDMHFIVKEMATCFESQVDVLALNREKYISITKHIPDRLQKGQTAITLRFIDSFR